MSYKIYYKTFSNITTEWLLSTVAFVLLFVSCQTNSKPPIDSKNDLIDKINAVQEQIMAQGNMTEEEERALLSICSIVSHDDGMATYTSDNSILLKNVEHAPIYNGCENLSKLETRACFDKNISRFITSEFNLSVLRDLNLSSAKQVEAFFIIDESGNLTGMKVRNAEVTFQAELLRVLRKIPVMKPARYNNENVSVLCSIVLEYENEIDVVVTYIPERPE